MSAPFVAEIRMFAGNFAPTGWALCNGALLPISQNTALFALLGTFYGGDGKSTFALPDLDGMVPIHQGQGQGLSERFLGESSGSEAVTLLQSEMPVHTHSHSLGAGDNDNASPTGTLPGLGERSLYRSDANTTFNTMAVGVAGGSLPHNNMQPYLAVTFMIALQGVFPQRP